MVEMVKISELTFQQIRHYFEARLQDARFRTDSPRQMVRCPFHQDSTPSLSIDLEKGIWHCHAGCGSGGLIDFEVRFAGCDRSAALAAIFGVIGLEHSGSIFAAQPEAIYSYENERRQLVFQKLRFPGKKFSQRKPNGNGGWTYRLDSGHKPLYKLPEVITSNCVVICEGEKDCDNVNKLNLAQYDETGFTRIVATTNFDGAGKWDEENSPYLAGKVAISLPDNDAVGKRHAETVAASVDRYAFTTRIVHLPGLPEKGDASDYLETHSGEDLWKDMLRTPLWQPAQSPLIVTASEFLIRASEEIDWLVGGVIQRGSNGFIVSEPKVGKSWVAVDLALSLALGEPWVDFIVPQRSRVALITREDNPNLTKWRMEKLLAGKRKIKADLDEWLWVNSKDQSPQFRLDDPGQLADMMAALQQVKPEFVILDVFNVLHAADENDNTEMRKVLDCADLFHRELKAGVCILHHFNKSHDGRLTQRMRGSSAIAGWAEWVMGLSVASQEPREKIRSLEFELKASEPQEHIYFAIDSTEASSKLSRVQYQPPVSTGSKRARFEVV